MPHHEQTDSVCRAHQQVSTGDQHDRPPEQDVTRRAVMAGTGLLAVTALGACTSYGEQAAPPGAPQAPPPGGGELAKTTDIPVGGGQVFPAQEVVVTQPAPAQFRAFSAICTHQGCTVGSVENGTINCPCHGSKFAAADGSVIEGPATQPLPPRQVQVDGDRVRLV